MLMPADGGPSSRPTSTKCLPAMSKAGGQIQELARRQFKIEMTWFQRIAKPVLRKKMVTSLHYERQVWMIRKFFLMLTATVLGWGCATTQQTPKIQFAADTRVGIINRLEAFVTHQNFSELRVNSFSKTYNVDWNLPLYVQDQLTRYLKNDARYSVMTLKPAKSLEDPSIIDRIPITGEINREGAKFLNKLADRNDVNVIIIIKSFRGPGPLKIGKQPIQVEGYGLVTREFVVFKKAYAYANIAVIVFKTEPPAHIGSGKPKVKDSPLNDFKLPGNLKNLAQSDIDKLRPIIEKYADQAVKTALGNANLVSTP